MESLSLFELFGLSFARTGKNGDLIASASRKNFCSNCRESPQWPPKQMASRQALLGRDTHSEPSLHVQELLAPPYSSRSTARTDWNQVDMVSNCTVPRGVGSITASSKKLQERMLTDCQQCLLWFLNINYCIVHMATSLSLFELFGLSFARTQERWLDCMCLKKKLMFQLSWKPHVQELLAPSQKLNWSQVDMDLNYMVCRLPRVSYLPSGPRAWRFICVLESVWLTDDIEYPTRLRVWNSFRCRANALSPSLWSAPTLQLVVCVVSSGPKYPSRASGGSCTTWNGTCMHAMQHGACPYWHPCRGAKTCVIRNPRPCLLPGEAGLTANSHEGKAHEQLLEFWLFTTKCQMGIQCLHCGEGWPCLWLYP